MTDIKDVTKEFKKGMKRGKKILGTIDAINSAANDSVTKIIVTTYTSDQSGNQSVVIDTVRPITGGGLKGNWKPIPKGHTTDSTKSRSVKIKKN